MSSSAMAEPSGSLKAMLETKITLIEYYVLMTKIQNVHYLVVDRRISWGDSPTHESLVQIYPSFDYENSKLKHDIQLFNYYYTELGSISDAKAYCKGILLSASWLLAENLLSYLRPNGWGNSKTNAKDFEDNVFANSTMETTVSSGQIAEDLPKGEHKLECTASLDKYGQIYGWTFNI
ncbi:hypothetical protein N9Z13_06985 [Luminiphilus sp.]|nr:hypothetical protein [Luminiphilus sp.]